MSNAHATVESKNARVAETRIRFGHAGDIPAIARLIHRANAADGIPHIDACELEAIADQHHMIVLQLRPDEIVAAACIVNGRGVVFLVIDPEVASCELEHRMLGVAQAICESEGSPDAGHELDGGRWRVRSFSAS